MLSPIQLPLLEELRDQLQVQGRLCAWRTHRVMGTRRSRNCWQFRLIKIHAQGVPPRDDVEHVDVAEEARLRLRPAAHVIPALSKVYIQACTAKTDSSMPLQEIPKAVAAESLQMFWLQS